MHTTLEFNLSYCVILGGTRAESERLAAIMVKDFGGRWQFSAELKFCSSGYFCVPRTETGSCPGQLPHEPFRIGQYPL